MGIAETDKAHGNDGPETVTQEELQSDPTARGLVDMPLHQAIDCALVCRRKEEISRPRNSDILPPVVIPNGSAPTPPGRR